MIIYKNKWLTQDEKLSRNDWTHQHSEQVPTFIDKLNQTYNESKSIEPCP